MSSAQTNEWLLLLLCPPGEPRQPAGILLLDSVSNKLDIKLNPTINVEDELVLEFWAELADDLKRQADEVGGACVIARLEETVSLIIQISSRSVVPEGQSIEDLYREHVDQAPVKELSQGMGA